MRVIRYRGVVVFVRVVDGELEFGTLSAFLLLAIYVIGALGGLADLFSALMSAVGASQRVFVRDAASLRSLV